MRRDLDRMWFVGDEWAAAHGIEDAGVTAKCLFGHLVVIEDAIITHYDDDEAGYVRITAQVWNGPEVKFRVPDGTYMSVCDGDDMFRLFDLIVRSHINQAREEAEQDAE